LIAAIAAAALLIPATATDLDTGATRSIVTNVADESGVDEPSGGSVVTFLAPLAVVQAAGTVLGGSPARLTGRAGRKVTATLRLRHVGGRLEKRRVRLRLPSDLRPGRRRVVFAGVDSDASGGGDLFEQFDVDFLFGSTGGALGPRNRRTLLRRIEGDRALRRHLGPPAEQRPGGLRSGRAVLSRSRAADLRARARDDPDQGPQAPRARPAARGVVTATAPRADRAGAADRRAAPRRRRA